jgi:hypothetical protein
VTSRSILAPPHTSRFYLRDLETPLKGFNQAYNRRAQRVLIGASPEQVMQRREATEPNLAHARFKRSGLRAFPQALLVVTAAKNVSHPETSRDKDVLAVVARAKILCRCPLRRAEAQRSHRSPFIHTAILTPRSGSWRRRTFVAREGLQIRLRCMNDAPDPIWA